jgi:hypothetical protein
MLSIRDWFAGGLALRRACLSGRENGMGPDNSRVDYCCDCFSVVVSFLTVTLAGESGLEESVLTSTLFELLLDSVAGAGAGAAAAGAGVAAGAAAAAAGGACWQPMSVRPRTATTKTANSLQKFGFI